MKIWDDAPLRLKGFVVIGIPLIPLFVIAALILVGARRAGTASDWVGRANRAEAKIAEVLRYAVDADTASLSKAVAELPPLVFDSPEQMNHVRTIATLVDRLGAPPVDDDGHRAITRALRTE